MIKKLFFISALATSAFYFGQTVIYQENFENPANRALWNISELDGDNDTWEFLDATLNEVPSSQGYFGASFSWYFEAFTPDNVLTSPTITLPSEGNLDLTFKVAAGDDELYEEHYAVYLIPSNSTFTGTEIPVFEETLDAGYTSSAKTVNIDISSYAGQAVKIVFRHYNCSDIFYMGIDDVKITRNNLSVVDETNTDFQVYPNPATDFINIKTSKNFDRIKIFDLSGKVIKETTSFRIDVQSLPKGTYILNVHAQSNIISRKFIKK